MGKGTFGIRVRFFLYRRRTNGSADACSRQRADRSGVEAVQKARRAKRDAERAPSPPILRKAVRTAAAGPTPQGEVGPQGSANARLSQRLRRSETSDSVHREHRV